MARKNNIRSIRFSDKLASLIEQQIGTSFTDKFERLITRCVWELPAKEAELQRIQEQIDQERERLTKIQSRRHELEVEVESVSRELQMFTRTMHRSTAHLQNLIDRDCNTD